MYAKNLSEYLRAYPASNKIGFMDGRAYCRALRVLQSQTRVAVAADGMQCSCFTYGASKKRCYMRHGVVGAELCG